MSYQYEKKTSASRKAVFKNAASNLIMYGQIETVEQRAKELKIYVERLVTLAKKADLNSIRKISGLLVNKEYKNKRNLTHHLVHDIAPKYKDREGGYLQILKIYKRKGDNAQIVIIKFI